MSRRNKAKFPCPVCGRGLSTVVPDTKIGGIDTDLQQGVPIYRRIRKCLHCEHRYTTTERIENTRLSQ